MGNNLSLVMVIAVDILVDLNDQSGNIAGLVYILAFQIRNINQILASAYQSAVNQHNQENQNCDNRHGAARNHCNGSHTIALFLPHFPANFFAGLASGQ